MEKTYKDLGNGKVEITIKRIVDKEMLQQRLENLGQNKVGIQGNLTKRIAEIDKEIIKLNSALSK